MYKIICFRVYFGFHPATRSKNFHFFAVSDFFTIRNSIDKFAHTDTTSPALNIAEILRKYFGIYPAGIKALDGYANINYPVITEDKKYVPKQYTANSGLKVRLGAESRIVLFLPRTVPGAFRKPVPTKTGAYILSARDGKRQYLFRLLHFIEEKAPGKK